MTWLEALQLMLIAFKLFGIINWSWWIVLFPIIFMLISFLVGWAILMGIVCLNKLQDDLKDD